MVSPPLSPQVVITFRSSSVPPSTNPHTHARLLDDGIDADFSLSGKCRAFSLGDINDPSPVKQMQDREISLRRERIEDLKDGFKERTGIEWMSFYDGDGGGSYTMLEEDFDWDEEDEEDEYDDDYSDDDAASLLKAEQDLSGFSDIDFNFASRAPSPSVEQLEPSSGRVGGGTGSTSKGLSHSPPNTSSPSENVIFSPFGSPPPNDDHFHHPIPNPCVSPPPSSPPMISAPPPPPLPPSPLKREKRKAEAADLGEGDRKEPGVVEGEQRRIKRLPPANRRARMISSAQKVSSMIKSPLPEEEEEAKFDYQRMREIEELERIERGIGGNLGATCEETTAGLFDDDEEEEL